MRKKETDFDIVDICMSDVGFYQEKKVTYADIIAIPRSDACFDEKGKWSILIWPR